MEPYLPDAWTRLPIDELNPEEVEDRFKQMQRACNRSKREFEQLKLKNPRNMAEGMIKVLDNFKAWLPIIRALNTEGLKDKHLKLINQKINEGKDIEMNLELNMDISQLTNMGILKCTEDIEEIADNAGKEFKNEMTLKSMKEEWQPINFECKEHKDTFILDGEATEAIQVVLDDHLIKTQTMKGSPYA